MAERYPGYDVMAKRHTPSWNDQTRDVLAERLAIDPERRVFFDEGEWLTLKSICERIIPQPPDRETPAPLAAMIDDKMARNATDGYRNSRLPAMRTAWRLGLAALDAEARKRRNRPFHALSADERDGLLGAAQAGYLDDPAWGDMPAKLFFEQRILTDVVGAYYAHPAAWNEIGYGGPAAPRGYVRMGFDQRDPWEASEARTGRQARALRENRRVGRT